MNEISILGSDMQAYLKIVLDYVERNNKQDKELSVAQSAEYLSRLIPKEPECEFGHVCTGACQETVDCPCVNDHYCSMSGEHSEMDCDDQDEGCPQHPKPDHADLVNDNLNERFYENRTNNKVKSKVA